LEVKDALTDNAESLVAGRRGDTSDACASEWQTMLCEVAGLVPVWMSPDRVCAGLLCRPRS